MKCWVQSIQMRRWRALIHPALLAPDGPFWGSPTVARSCISAAAMPFFRVRQSRRLIAAADHFDIASFRRSFCFSLLFHFNAHMQPDGYSNHHDFWELPNLVISRNNRSKTFAWLRQANMICPGPSEIYPAPFLSLTKHARKFKKRKKRK